MHHRFPSFSQFGLCLLAALVLACPLAQAKQAAGGPERPQARLTQRPLIVAHRGRSAPDQPENSLRQMQQLATRKIGVEMDLTASKDGVLYLLHDDTLDRTTTGAGPLAAQDSTALDAVRLKAGNGQPTDEPLPRLTQVLDWAAQAPEVMLMLDLKNTPAAKVMPLLTERNMLNRVILLTFNRSAGAAALRDAPGVMVSVLVNTQSEINFYRRLAGARPLAMYVSQKAKPALFAKAQTAQALVISDVLQDDAADVAPLPGKIKATGCAAYHEYLDLRRIDVLVSNNPVCAAEDIK